jgi:hypothetical protein
MEIEIRKVAVQYEDVMIEGGRNVTTPLRLAAAAAVISNPYAGRYEQDLKPLFDLYCGPLGELLAERSLAALDHPEVEAYGKGALIGLDGELEHGSGILHNLAFGNPVRTAMGASSLLPSTEKRGAAGATLDVPLKHVEDHKVRSHHLTFEMRIGDAPRPDEIVVVIACASGGRPHARLADFGSEVAEHGAAPD